MTKGLVIENCVTIVATVALILGLRMLGVGAWSWFGLVLMLNINYTGGPES
jgi:hypothetical protein